MKSILQKIAKLIDVKSIITIILTLVFAYLTINQIICNDFMRLYTMIVCFYFGTQYEKNKKDIDKNNDV